MATTALFSIASAGTAAAAGLVIARSLGPSARGEYAAVNVWFGFVLTVAQLGQPPAITYFVAKDPGRARDYLATSRNMMIASGLVTVLAGILVAAPLLGADNDTMVMGYRLSFATCLLSLAGVSYTFALQAKHLPSWNTVLFAQSASFLVAIVALKAIGHLGVLSALAALTFTIAAQSALAYVLCARRRLTCGRADLALARPITRYGLSQLAASIPYVITGWLDQLALSLTVAPADLGHYAVAVSLTSLAVPLVSAVGSVTFPRLASQAMSHAQAQRLQRWAIMTSAAVGGAFMLVLAASAQWLVPAVFGPEFRQAVPLTWLLAPGGVFFACGRVCADLLRGRGAPAAVAWAQGTSAVTVVVLIGVLLPLLGVRGAAIASSTSAGVALGHMLWTLRKLSTQVPPRPAETSERGRGFVVVGSAQTPDPMTALSPQPTIPEKLA